MKTYYFNDHPCSKQINLHNNMFFDCRGVASGVPGYKNLSTVYGIKFILGHKLTQDNHKFTIFRIPKI